MVSIDSKRSTTLTLRANNERLALRLPVHALVIFVSLLMATIALIILSLTLGSYEMTLAQTWQTLVTTTVPSQQTIILWEFRFPRAIVSVLVGAMLALSGAALQNVTRNGLADPSLVGISQGAGLAVVTALVIWPDATEWRAWLACGGSLIVAALIQGLSWNRYNGGNSIRFILMGIGIAAFISSLTSAMMTYGEIDRAMSALAWLSGSINVVGWGEVKMLSMGCFVLIPMLLMLSRPMSALQMGEVMAVGLGVSAKWIRLALIACSVGFAALATAAVGPLGFVGLIAPHVARRMTHSGVGLHLLISAVVGALLVASADLLGRTLFAPTQIPAGLVTAIIGVPAFIVLLRKTHSNSSM